MADSTAKTFLVIDDWGFHHLITTELKPIDIGNGETKLVKIYRHPTEEERANAR